MRDFMIKFSYQQLYFIRQKIIDYNQIKILVKNNSKIIRDNTKELKIF